VAARQIPSWGTSSKNSAIIRKLPEQADFRKYKRGWLDMFTRLIDPARRHDVPARRVSALRLLAIPHPMGGLMVTFEDVTSRLELESSYNTLIAVQKETLDNLAEGVAAFGGDGRLRLYNPAFARLWNRCTPRMWTARPISPAWPLAWPLTFAEDEAAAARKKSRAGP
jgi:PAS domain-containing protein